MTARPEVRAIRGAADLISECAEICIPLPPPYHADDFHENFGRGVGVVANLENFFG